MYLIETQHGWSVGSIFNVGGTLVGGVWNWSFIWGGGLLRISIIQIFITGIINISVLVLQKYVTKCLLYQFNGERVFYLSDPEQFCISWNGWQPYS